MVAITSGFGCYHLHCKRESLAAGITGAHKHAEKVLLTLKPSLVPSAGDHIMDCCQCLNKGLQQFGIPSHMGLLPTWASSLWLPATGSRAKYMMSIPPHNHACNNSTRSTCIHAKPHA